MSGICSPLIPYFVLSCEKAFIARLKYLFRFMQNFQYFFLFESSQSLLTFMYSRNI